VNELAAFLRAIVERPNDLAPKLVLADWLEERWPASPVALGHLPNWLRLAWLKGAAAVNRAAERAWQQAAPADPYGLLLPPEPYLPAETRSGSGVAGAIQTAIDHTRHLGGVYLPSLDHWGSTRLAGHLCFVNEPYARPAAAVLGLSVIADIAGGVVGCGHTSAWGHGTVRVLLFPPEALTGQTSRPATPKARRKR
jgi:hypothetical protein